MLGDNANLFLIKVLFGFSEEADRIAQLTV